MFPSSSTEKVHVYCISPWGEKIWIIDFILLKQVHDGIIILERFLVRVSVGKEHVGDSVR